MVSGAGEDREEKREGKERKETYKQTQNCIITRIFHTNCFYLQVIAYFLHTWGMSVPNALCKAQLTAVLILMDNGPLMSRDILF